MFLLSLIRVLLETEMVRDWTLYKCDQSEDIISLLLLHNLDHIVCEVFRKKSIIFSSFILMFLAQRLPKVIAQNPYLGR